MADNQSSVLLDQDGDDSDWIEIYNSSTAPVNLGGYFLSQNPNVLNQWRFPFVTLQPRSHLVVFASGKHRTNALAQLHSNFKLSAGGGFLALVEKDGKTSIVQFEYPEQRSGVSYGIPPDGSAPAYFLKPSPGATNNNSMVPGFVAPVHFSHPHGFYENPFRVELSCETPGAVIRYTLDGTLPSLTNGTAYTGQLLVTNTTTLRAATFKPGLGPAPSGTRSYLFLNDVLLQTGLGYPVTWGNTASDYAMDPLVLQHPSYRDTIKNDLLSIPSMSIVMPPEDLWGPNGIYSNTEREGDAWERGGSIELIFPDGSTGFQENCGFRMQGGASRQAVHTSKHTFRMTFKNQYGPSRLKYKFFKDSPVEEFDTVVLRATFNDGWAWLAMLWPGGHERMPQYTRDPFVRANQQAMSGLASHNDFVHLYVNGLYWGLYNPCEKTASAFGAAYFGGEKKDYDTMNTGNAIDGDARAWGTLMSRVRSGVAGNTQYQNLKEYLDIPFFIDYIIANLFGANTDWPHNNWTAVRHRGGGMGFKFLVWDAEWTMATNPNENRVEIADDNSPGIIFSRLRQNAEFRLLFADHLHRHFFNDGAMMSPQTLARYQALADQIDRAVVGESARWGDARRVPPYTRDLDWAMERDRILTNYLPQRSGLLLAQFKAANLYPNLGAPAFNQHGGVVPPGFQLSMSPPSGAIYFTTNGMDPRVPFTGAIYSNAVRYTVPLKLQKSMLVKARVLQGTTWSALNEAIFQVGERGSPLRITELMYNPPGGDAFEFLEVKNTADYPLDVSGYHFEGIEFMFPWTTVLPPGGVAVVASDMSPPVFTNRYSRVNVLGWFGGRLSNDGETIRIRDSKGALVTSVTYNDSTAWPQSPDGGGYSLEVIDPKGDPDDPGNWKSSSALFGSPGAQGAGSSPTILLSEIMAENRSAVKQGSSFPDWVELQNISNISIDLRGWTIADQSGRSYTIGVPTIMAPGGFLLIWFDSDQSAPGLHTGFGLSRRGDGVYLFDAGGRRVDGTTFGYQLADFSMSRIEGKWVLSEATPLALNKPAPVAPSASLSINEWLANPFPGAKDWIEIYNKDVSKPASLQGLYFESQGGVFRYALPAFLPPKGFLQMVSDPDPGADHLPLKFSAQGDTLVLFDEAGKEIERVVFGAQSEGISSGRFPDGTATLFAFPDTGSPGASNYLLQNAGVQLNELFASNVRAVADPWGDLSNYIELRNTSASPVSLEGMALRVGESGGEEWSFPGGISLPAGAHLLVWCNPDLPAARKNETHLNSGLALEPTGGSVFLLNSLGQVVDRVRFGFQIPDRPIGFSSGWNLLSAPTPGTVNASALATGPSSSLRINEWMANPENEADWLELYNAGDLPVSLAGLYLTDNPTQGGRTNFQMGPLSFIAPKGFVRWWADGNPLAGANHLPFSLNGGGEALRLYSPALELIDGVDFSAQQTGISSGRLPDGGAAIVSFPGTPSPAASNYLPVPGIRFNELLLSADSPYEGAIELWNSGTGAVAIGGWKITDLGSSPGFQIPAGTTLPPGGFKVFYQGQFEGTGNPMLSLSDKLGGRLALQEVDSSGNLTGRRVYQSYFPAEKNSSIGVFQTSVGWDFVPLSNKTFGVDRPASLQEFRSGNGAANSASKVGPIAVTEIMYQPSSQGPDNPDEEYVELTNVSNAPVTFNDPGRPQLTWRVRGGIQFEFPANLILQPGQTLVLVRFDPGKDLQKVNAFRNRYKIPSGVLLQGPFRGRLDNSGEAIILSRPGTPVPVIIGEHVPHFLLETVHYRPTAPWPEARGISLHRKVKLAHGNDPMNWTAGDPSPGFEIGQDGDRDGIPDDWEISHGLDRNNPHDALQDFDFDGQNNLEEYLAGTNPRDPGSVLKLSGSLQSGVVRLSFLARDNKSYEIQGRFSLEGNPAWGAVLQVPAGQERVVTFDVPNAPPGEGGFYRIRLLLQ